MEDIGGLPFWQLTFDAQGDVEPAGADAVLDAVKNRQVTDLVFFSHGWNNSQEAAGRLYKAWFGTLAAQRASFRTDRPVQLGLVGVFWPSQRWSDEPIPDFQPVAAGAVAGGGGAAAVIEQQTAAAGSTALDQETLTGLRTTFPEAVDHLDRIADLLASEPSSAGLIKLKAEMDAFAAATAVADAQADSTIERDSAMTPGMLDDEARDLFRRYAVELRSSGLIVDDGGGQAGLVDSLKGLWHGAKEAFRGLTYWQMKNRAGLVGRNGLGPFLGRLAVANSDLRVNLVGHSFGARLVSFALLGLPAGKPSPVASVTLLQGAFSHFAFAGSLPFDAGRKGALAGMFARISGPLTVCFSEHDDAVGKFYPLASMANQDDAAAAQDRFFRWGGMGHDGAQAVSARRDDLQPAGPGAVYRFADGAALNIDCSEIVRRGGPPSGAHSDIVYPELTWVVLKAGRIVT